MIYTTTSGTLSPPPKTGPHDIENDIKTPVKKPVTTQNHGGRSAGGFAPRTPGATGRGLRPPHPRGELTPCRTRPGETASINTGSDRQGAPPPAPPRRSGRGLRPPHPRGELTPCKTRPGETASMRWYCPKANGAPRWACGRARLVPSHSAAARPPSRGSLMPRSFCCAIVHPGAAAAGGGAFGAKPRPRRAPARGLRDQAHAVGASRLQNQLPPA